MLLFILLPFIYDIVLQVAYNKRNLVVLLSSRYSKVIFILLYKVITLHMKLTSKHVWLTRLQVPFFGSLFQSLSFTLQTICNICCKSCLVYFGTALSIGLEVSLFGSKGKIVNSSNSSPKLKTGDLFLNKKQVGLLALQG